MEAPNTDLNAKISFEEALQKLEEVVRALESGDATLEDSLAKYEQGVGLLRHCYAVLRTAEQRVRLMADEDEHGKPLPKPFPNAAGHDDEPEPRRRSGRSTDSTY